jgi:hypothetical protein
MSLTDLRWRVPAADTGQGLVYQAEDQAFEAHGPDILQHRGDERARFKIMLPHRAGSPAGLLQSAQST